MNNRRVTEIESDHSEAEPANPEPGDRGWMLVGYSLAIVFAVEILEHSTLTNHHLLRDATTATLGFVSVDLIASLIALALTAFLLLGVGKFRLSHIGIRPRAIVAGIGVGLALWGLTQVLLAIVSLGRTGMVTVYRGWEGDPLATFLGLPRFAFGEALFEELFFRGYLLVWMVLECQRRMKDKFVGSLTAVMLSQVLFALVAIPGRVAAGIPWTQFPIELLLLTLTGIYYSILYIRTDNIFIPVALHALTLWPAPLFDPHLDPAKLSILVSAIFLVIPPRTRSSTEMRYGSRVWD